MDWQSEMRHRGIGMAVSAVVFVVALAFFHDAGAEARRAIGMGAFVSALVVAHTLDAVDRHRHRNRRKTSGR